jgi:hypothetical protein
VNGGIVQLLRRKLGGACQLKQYDRRKPSNACVHGALREEGRRIAWASLALACLYSERVN